MRLHCITASVLSAVLSPFAAAGEPKALCEWERNPQAMADPCPEFFWEAPGQAAYRLLVATRRELLEHDGADAWDSGWSRTPLTVAEYDGKPLEDQATYYWTVHVRDRSGRAKPAAPAQTFTTRFGSLPRRLPHIRTFLNFGSNAKLIAQRYDATFRKDAKKHRPEVVTVNYALLATMCIPSPKAKRLAEFCVERGITKKGIREEMFLHFAKDTQVSLYIRNPVARDKAGNPFETRTVPGWNPANDRNRDGQIDDAEFAERVDAKASARRLGDARVPIYYWGPPVKDFIMNVGHPLYQEYLGTVWAPRCVRGFDGLFIDTTTPNVPIGGPKFEFPAGDPQGRTWLAAMQLMLARVKMGIGKRLLTGNCWHAKPFVLDGTEWENWLNIAAPVGRVEAMLRAVIDIDRRGKIQFVQYNPAYHPKESAFGVKVEVDKARDQIYGLALYYLCHGDRTYFGFGQHPYIRSERKWFDAIAYDVGQPKGPYYTLSDRAKPVPTEGNLLRNPGFETDNDNDGNPDHWVAYEPVEVSDESPRSGRRCAKVTKTDSSDFGFNKQYVTLEPDTFYTLSGWIRTENVTSAVGAQIYAYEFDDMAGKGISLTMAGTRGWTFLCQVLKTGSDVKGRVNFRLMRTTGTAWFDDLSLVKGVYASAKVLARDFEKALVLVKPTPGAALLQEGLESTHALDATFRPLRSDGTLGPATDRITLRCGEAAILVRQP